MSAHRDRNPIQIDGFVLLLLFAIFFITDAELQNFGDQKAIHDEAHMKEHLKDKIGVDAPMSEEQKRFHYFWINDLNHDGKLDGIEILKSMSHSHDGHLTEIFSDEQVEKLVDISLNSLDLDRDGLVSFAEYKKITESS
nr:multiple coagulation factor deficiency protein 2 [Haemonchus contortus]